MKIKSHLRAGQPLGDQVKKWMDMTGVSKSADRYTAQNGRDCGCEKRKWMLNHIFSHPG